MNLMRTLQHPEDTNPRIHLTMSVEEFHSLLFCVSVGVDQVSQSGGETAEQINRMGRELGQFRRREGL